MAATTKQLQLEAAAPPTLPPPQHCCSAPAVPRAHDEEDDEVIMGRWRSSLASGLRAAMACTIVGLVSLYAPPTLRRHITFPAFSYVVTVIIVTDATLGTALHGAVSAVHATLMGAGPSVLALWLAHRTGAAESVLVTSAVVALTTFAVALPESAGPVAKRIALGQIIIIYVAKFQQGEHPSGAFVLLHPANVVACTALGAAAALLAVLLPWPRLSTREARDNSREYRVLAAERVRVMVDAFFVVANSEAAACSRQRRWQMAACMSEARRLASASTALLHRINSSKEDLQWERAAAGLLKKKCAPATEELHNHIMEMPLTGMQIALEIQAAGSGGSNKGHDVGLVMAMRDHICLALLTQNKSSSSYHRLGSSTAVAMTLPQAQSSSSSWRHEEPQQLAPLLFLFSLYLLHRRCGGGTHHMLLEITTTSPEAAFIVTNAKQVVPAATAAQEDLVEQAAAGGGEKADNNVSTTATIWRRRRLMAAAKCGFSLGLAVLLGLLFSNDHGFWSGLIVATTMSAGRESTWAVGVARAHGTALGSIYGVLGCLLISQQRLLTMDLRFLALLPWMVLATFLKRSRAYGPAGGVAAALSGIIIMGRRYDEAPMAFTIARLVETFIGISCAVVADLVFQPGARPSVQARGQLVRCIATLGDCFHSHASVRLQQQLVLLRKRAVEAGSEPTYLWLPPFPAACYDKMEGSLGTMAQLLHLYQQARATLVSSQLDVDVDVDAELRRFSSIVTTSLSHCLRMLGASLEEPNKGHQVDLEAGNGSRCRCCRCKKDEEATAPEEVLGPFLARAGGGGALLDDDNDEEAATEGKERGLLVCCVATIRLCMGEIAKEALRLEVHILDLNSLQPQPH